MKRDDIEDIYELSPTQQGMLFHTLYAAEPGVYFDQYAITLRGPVDLRAFDAAWRLAVQRHGALRTSFHWEKTEKPLQVVHRQVDVPIEHQDWRGLPPAEQRERLRAYLDSEMARGFDLTRAPLMRLSLVRTGEESFYFTWCNHHLLFDGWSRATLFREVLGSYEALRRGARPAPPPAVPYRNYIGWLRRQDLSKAEAYWRETLRGFGEPTPLAGTLPAAGTHARAARYEERRLRLGPETSAELASLARRHGLTLSTLVQGAWGLLLSRYTGAGDVVFGATVSGRPPTLPHVETLVGLFINTLPVRVRVAEDEPLLALLKRLQRQQSEMREYEHSPLVQVHGWSEVPRGVALFDSIVVFENYPVDDSMGRGESSLSIEGVEIVGRTNYPLTVTVAPGAELRVEISYDCGRFEAAWVERMLGHFKQLLTGMAALTPETPAAHLPLLTEEEERELLAGAGPTPRENPSAGGVHRLFEAQAARTPAETALVYGDERLSYEGLNRRADAVAQRLRGLGVRREGRVGVLLERGTAMLASLLGVLKAGGCYVPLDPRYPAARLSFMAGDAQLAALLTTRTLADSLGLSEWPGVADGPARVVHLDEWGASEWAGDGAAPPSAEAADAQLAYLIYTSGSTGKPKGVMVPHAALVNLLFSMAEEPGMAAGERLLALTTLSFDIAALELFMPLLVGGTLCLADEATTSDPSLLAAEIERVGADLVQATPATWRMLVESGWGGGARLRALCGGEALAEDLAAALAPRCGELWNMYGPTETTVWSLTSPVRGGGRVTLGRPIANTTAYVLDGRGRVVPAGVAGELYLGGDGVARGYWRRPALTAEKFVPDPFSSEPGARLYRTGDVVRRLPTGELEFLGRVDHQVKVRGHRIELGEIEAALRAQAGVREAVVAARGEGAEKRLVAYVVGGAEGESGAGAVNAGGLREGLRGKLPDYMVPSLFVLLESLPLTPNGKVDRKALPEPDATGAAADSYVAPRTPVEELVAGVWAEVLGVERVGARDDFFELGGHSLLATRAASRLREALGVEVGVRALFEAPTVEGLALRAEEELRRRGATVAPPLVRAARDGELPLSFAQQRLWFLDQLEPGSPAYNVPTAVRLSGRLNLGALERAFNEISRRHELLRTTFREVGGRPSQVIAPALAVGLPVVELGAVPAEEREGRVRQLALEEARRPFDLARGPLLRATLLRLSEDEHVALLTMHHIISDGWSMGVLVRDMLALYEAFSEGRPSPLRELPVQYADYAVWQREWLRGEVLEQQLDYWRGQLAGAPAQLELPTDMPRQALQTFRGGRQPFAIPQSLADALRALTRREGGTMFMALLAVFKTLLYRYSRQEDILVGVPVAGRRHGATEELIGFFVNTLVLRTDLSGAPDFKGLLRRVRETALDAYTHQDLPFEKLVEELQPERDLNRQPLFQVMFVFQEAPRPVSEAAGLRIEQLDVDSGSARFDLLLNLVETEDGVAGHLEYNTDLFHADSVARMLGHFRQLIEAVVARPEAPILDLPLLRESERLQLEEWNDTARDYADAAGRFECVHRMFEAQAERTPEAQAVVSGDGALSYRELNERANRLAHHLRGLGVGPDALVGLALERSAEMVVGVLGVLKAGGCYVPLDPAYPRERLTMMLEEVPVSVLVTERALDGSFPPHGARVVRLDADAELIARESGENPRAHVEADNLFYTIFTSGSTGRPKGVAAPHRFIANLVRWHVEELCSGVRTLQFASLSFDVSCYEIFMCLASGGALHVIPEALRRDTPALAKYLLEHRVEKMILPVGALQQLAEEYGALPALGRHFREITSAGERMKVTPQLAALFERLGSCRLLNNYGPSETHVIIVGFLDGRPETWKMHPPLGRPIANTQIHVLDQRLRQVPVGVAGEIHIGGVALARGYFNRPGMTAERFLPDPFSRTPGARMYKTGDLARYLPDGQLDYLGRIDFQVKIRGFRVEPGEVEAVLAAHPSVREAVVMAREDGPGGKRLVAYVIPADGGRAGAAELRGFLREKLPDYMVPAAFVFLDEFPLNPNRKIDRRALPAPDHSRPELGSPFVAPRSAAEELVADIWAGVLGLEQVGVRDNFFDLGGHSMLATQVVSRIRETFRAELPLRSLFQQPTVEGLVRELGREWGDDGVVEEIAETLRAVEMLTAEEVREMLAAEGQDVSV